MIDTNHKGNEMLEDLMDLSNEDLSEIKNPNTNSSVGYQGYQKQSYDNNQGNQNNQGNNGGGYQKSNNGGGYQNNGNSGGGFKGGFQRKEEVIEEPYIPVTIYIDREFPPEIKHKLINVASKLIARGVTVRYNGDDMDIHKPISELSNKLTEAYTPWKNFNDIESKHYWNTKTSDHLAQVNFSAWEKIPNVVKAMLSRNIRMIFGGKNNSITMCLITWSPDGATKAPEVGKDTGRASFIIKTAASYHFPVINLAKDNAESIIDKVFNLTSQ